MVLGRAQVVFSYDSTYLRIAVVRLHPLALSEMTLNYDHFIFTSA